jgi:hypothetical protein
MRSLLATAASLLLLGLEAGRTVASPPVAAPPTQRRINSYASALSAARREIVDETGLRRAGEPLPAYLTRVLRPLPGEPQRGFTRRLDRYAQALEQAADATAPLRTVPQVADRSAANLHVWDHAARLLRALGIQAAALRASASGAARDEAAERRAIAQGVTLAALALDDLRDALP